MPWSRCGAMIDCICLCSYAHFFPYALAKIPSRFCLLSYYQLECRLANILVFWTRDSWWDEEHRVLHTFFTFFSERGKGWGLMNLVVSLLAFGYKLEVVQLCCNLNAQLLGFSCIDLRLLSLLWFCLPFMSLFFSPCASLFFWFHRSTLVHFFFTFATLKYLVGSLILATL